MWGSKWLNLKETNQYLIFNNHKVFSFFTRTYYFLFQNHCGKIKQNLTLFSYDLVITLLWYVVKKINKLFLFTFWWLLLTTLEWKKYPFLKNLDSTKKTCLNLPVFIASLEYKVIKIFNHSLHALCNLILRGGCYRGRVGILQQIYRLGRC